MASWVLAADFRWRDGFVLRGGKILDDTIFPVAAMQLAGAQIQASSPAALAASAVALKNNANGLSNRSEVGAAIQTGLGVGGGSGSGFTAGGDLGGTSTSQTVNSLGGASPITILLASVLQWAATVAAPSISQPIIGAGAGADMSIVPQPAQAGSSGNLLVKISAPATGTTEAALVVQRGGVTALWLGQANSLPNSGQISFGSGANGGNAGTFILENASSLFLQTAGGTVRMQSSGVGIADFNGTGILFKQPLAGFASGNPFQLGNVSVTLANTGTTTLTAAQQQFPNISIPAVTLVGATTLAFGNIVGNYWVNVTNVVLGGQTLTFTNGTGTLLVSGLITAGENYLAVRCDTNAIAVG